MKRLYLTVLILVVLAFANSAFCTYTINDITQVSHNGTSGWADRIGDFIFEVYGIDVSWTSSKLIFSAYTNFDHDGTYPTPWSLGWSPSSKPPYYPTPIVNSDNKYYIHAYLADFFIDTNRDGTFEYGVVMKAHSAWTNCNKYPDTWVSSGSNNLGVGLYSVTELYSPSDFWGSGFIYGQYYSNSPANDAKTSYTAIKSGTYKGNATVGVTTLSGSPQFTPQFKWSIEIDRSALSSYDGKGMNVFWGGASK